MEPHEAKLEVWRDPKIGVVAQSRLIREKASLLCEIAREVQERTKVTVAMCEATRRRSESKRSPP